MAGRPRGATVARLTPDQKVACSSHVGVTSGSFSSPATLERNKRSKRRGREIWPREVRYLANGTESPLLFLSSRAQALSTATARGGGSWGPTAVAAPGLRVTPGEGDPPGQRTARAPRASAPPALAPPPPPRSHAPAPRSHAHLHLAQNLTRPRTGAVCPSRLASPDPLPSAGPAAPVRPRYSRQCCLIAKKRESSACSKEGCTERNEVAYT